MYNTRFSVHYGLCTHFSETFNVNNEHIDPFYPYPHGANKVLELLPELRAKEPIVHDTPDSSYWFDTNVTGHRKRRKLLLECIIEMEKKLFK